MNKFKIIYKKRGGMLGNVAFDHAPEEHIYDNPDLSLSLKERIIIIIKDIKETSDINKKINKIEELKNLLIEKILPDKSHEKREIDNEILFELEQLREVSGVLSIPLNQKQKEFNKQVVNFFDFIFEDFIIKNFYDYTVKSGSYLDPKSSNIFVAKIANLFKNKNINEILYYKYYNLLLYRLENNKFLYEESSILDEIIKRNLSDGTHILNNNDDYIKNEFLFNKLFSLILEKIKEELSGVNYVEKIELKKNIQPKNYQLDATIKTKKENELSNIILEFNNIYRKYSDIFNFKLVY